MREVMYTPVLKARMGELMALGWSTAGDPTAPPAAAADRARHHR